MIELYTNIWDHFNNRGEVILFTYARMLKKNGLAYMARGTSCQAKRRVGGIEKLLGRGIARNGATIHAITGSLWAFPTKQTWNGPADSTLIIRAIAICAQNAMATPFVKYYLPRPGCGHGGLDYHRSGIRQNLMTLPDNVFVVCKKEKDAAI